MNIWAEKIFLLHTPFRNQIWKKLLRIKKDNNNIITIKIRLLGLKIAAVELIPPGAVIVLQPSTVQEQTWNSKDFFGNQKILWGIRKKCSESRGLVTRMSNPKGRTPNSNLKMSCIKRCWVVIIGRDGNINKKVANTVQSFVVMTDVIKMKPRAELCYCFSFPYPQSCDRSTWLLCVFAYLIYANIRITVFHTRSPVHPSACSSISIAKSIWTTGIVFMTVGPHNFNLIPKYPPSTWLLVSVVLLL